MIIPFYLFAQHTPVFYYSHITSTFNGILPVGQKFQIKGQIEPNVVAVKIESFGLPMATSNQYISEHINQNIKSPIDFDAEDIIYFKAGWNRSSGENNEIKENIFSMIHPRLYYNRKYVFVFTYYQTIDNNSAIEIGKKEFYEVFKNISFKELLKNPNSIHKIRESLKNTAKPLLINKNTKTTQYLFDIVDSFSILNEITIYATAKKCEEEKNEDLNFLFQKLQSLNNDTSLLLSLKTIIANFDTFNFYSFKLNQKEPTKKLDSYPEIKYRLLNISYNNSTLKNIGYTSEDILGQLIQKLIDNIPQQTINEYIFECKPTTYLETMKDRYPFLISIDGGLIYSFGSIKRVIPSSAINIKLNPRDFDDPIDRTPEFSAIIGLGLKALNNASQQQFGIADTTDMNALVIGLGIRAPSISPIIRIQTGILIYRERETNNHNKITMKKSIYCGLSLNWDAIDFVAKHFKNCYSLGGLQ